MNTLHRQEAGFAAGRRRYREWSLAHDLLAHDLLAHDLAGH